MEKGVTELRVKNILHAGEKTLIEIFDTETKDLLVKGKDFTTRKSKRDVIIKVFKQGFFSLSVSVEDINKHYVFFHNPQN